ncbi:MAG: hypothetical protein AABW65_03355 [Nanoarchaeota archaeon]
MSEQSRKKQRELEKAISKTSRRKMLKNMAIATGFIAAAGFLAYKNFYKTSFLEAYHDPRLRERWLAQLDGRHYVAKKLATSDTIKELQELFSYTPERINNKLVPFADTISLKNAPIGHGTRSELYVYEESCFSQEPAQAKLARGLGVIVENVIENHELIHAEHFYNGIADYPFSWFFVDGKFNRDVFLAVSEIVCHRKEYEGLQEKARDDRYVFLYQSALKKLAEPYFAQVVLSSKNDKLMQQVNRERWF